MTERYHHIILSNLDITLKSPNLTKIKMINLLEEI